MDAASGPSRRQLLLGLAAGGLVTGCARVSAEPGATALASPPGNGSATAVPTAVRSSGAAPAASVPRLPTTHPWQARHGEYAPAVKLRAVRLVEALAAWRVGQQGLVPARHRAAALGLDPALADQAGPLVGPASASAAQVVDAQYGGILPGSADVLVVVRWWRVVEGQVRQGGTTVQVLLSADQPRWRVTRLVPAAPGPATVPSAQIREVLSSSRIRLPYAARADVASGAVHSSVLTALLALGRTYTIDVSVIRSGHPLHVFGTDRLSDHPRGRAVDVWAVDGRTVVDPANRALTERVMRQGITLGAWQVGGPVDLDGPGLQYFSDHTHQDHIHMGFPT